MEAKWVKAWRRSQAYGVPLTPEGVQRCNLKAEGFEKGFEAGMKHAVELLEREHSEHKKVHRFFFIASQLIRKNM